MKLWINGELREVPEHLTSLADLAHWLGLPSFGSAIELDREVIRRADYPVTPLKEGNRLEVVRLVGGG